MVVICGVCDLHADLFVCGLLCCVLGMYVVMLVAWFVCVWCLLFINTMFGECVCLHFFVHVLCVWLWFVHVLFVLGA